MNQRVEAELNLVMAKLLRERADLDRQIADLLEKQAAQQINAGDGPASSGVGKGDDAPCPPLLLSDKSPRELPDVPGIADGSLVVRQHPILPQPDHRREDVVPYVRRDETPHGDPAPPHPRLP